MALRYSVFKGYAGERGLLPKKENKYLEDGKALVSQVNGDDIGYAVRQSVKKIGGFNKVIKPGSSVLLKPNFVFPVPYPCTTSPDFLTAVIGQCFDAGASRVVVGERCVFQRTTRNVARALGLDSAITNAGGKLVFFDEGRWHSVHLGLSSVKKVTLPEEAWKHDALIYLPNLKTHHLARFTMSLKLTIGMTHQMEMPTMMFLGDLEQKIAEINAAVWPDLIIMDARKCFVSDGPSTGDIAEPNAVLASGDRCAIDAAGVKILKSYPAKNKLVYADPFHYTQIKRAGEIGVGIRSDKEMKIVKCAGKH